MTWWSKLLGRKPHEASSPELSKAVWSPADANRFGIPVLDLFAVTRQLMSTTSDPENAARAMSWSKTFVADIELGIEAKRTKACALRYYAERDLPDGWLFVPSEMEEKWAIAYRSGSIWLIRSWTATVIAAASTRREDEDLVIERIELADDSLEMFGEPVHTFDWILRSHALGEVLPLPVDDEGARMLESTPLAVFGPYGHVAKCAAIGWNPPPQTQPLRSCGDLATAVRNGDADRVASLAKAGASVSSRALGGMTPLHIAAINKNVELTRLLLDHGADPNLLDDREQSIVITALVHEAPVALLDLLVARGADVHRANRDGFGMIHAIAETDQPSYLAWAIAHGVTLERRTRHGHTPLHVAAGLGHVEALRALVAAGADRTARDPSNKTARDIAVAENKLGAVKALEE